MAVTQASIAKAWGCSPAYVSRCVKRGCPTTSIEAATAWRHENSKHGVGYQQKPAGNVVYASPNVVEEATNTPLPSIPPVSGGLGSLESSLEAAIRIEEMAHQLVLSAKNNTGSLSVRIQAYNKAREGRLKTEEMIRKIREQDKVTINQEEAKAIMRRAWVPLINRLRTFGRDYASEINPSDDIHAESIINEKMELLIEEVSESFE